MAEILPQQGHDPVAISQQATTSKPNLGHILIKFLPVACGLLLLAGYAFLTYNLNRTLDLSDEGSYLLQISRPFDDAYRVHDYGVLLHPIFSILGEDVYALRLFSLFTLGLSAMFFGLGLGALESRLGYKLSISAQASLLCALPTAALTYYCNGPLTPSYNWCNLVGVLICLASLCLYTAVCLGGQSSGRWLARTACLGGVAFGGVVSFLGKPTTAAGLAIVGCLWITLLPTAPSRRRRLGDILVAACLAATLLVLHFAFLAEGLGTAINKYKAGMWAMSLVPMYSLSSLIQDTHFYPDQKQWAWRFIGIFALYLISLELFRRYHTDGKKTFIATLVAVSATFSAVSLIVSQPLGYLYPTLVLLTFVIMLLYTDYKTVPKRLFLLPLFIFISLYFYHFGSGNDYSYNTSKALVILAGGMLAAFSLTKPAMRNSLVIAAALMVSIFALASLAQFIKKPYRQDAPLFALNAPLKLRENSTPLYVTQSRKEFMECIRKMALAHGWRPGMPMIHLSFDVSAVPFMLQAKSTGTQVSARPVYMPLKNLVQYYRKAATYQELRQSWILCYGTPEPKPYAFAPTSILVDLGIPFPQGYKLLGTCDGWQLWKPLPHPASGQDNHGQ
jgi:hypothetical protein